MIWYKKLSIHLIQLAMLNAYVIYKSADSSRRMSFLDFTKSVITSLLFENQQTQSLTADSPNEDMMRLNDIFQRKLLQLDQRQTHRSAVRFVTAKKLDMKADICVAAAPASLDCVLMSASEYIIPKQSTGSNWHQT